ncbi:phage holin [uncultured Bifidobacterium sp.]|uniref:phage holin n=1 Tax=uncultured Bifidobacterium sp. TaxID=165187 RepID=UPI002598E680|nr:phage holin [uncultured Bifidobacterium sp.]
MNDETKPTEETEETFEPEFVQDEIIPLLMSDKTYNIMKWIVQYILPGLGVLYAIIAGATGLPYAEVVLAVVMAVDWFLGIILGISTKQYNKYVAKK